MPPGVCFFLEVFYEAHQSGNNISAAVAFFSSPGLEVHHNTYGILVSPRRFQNQALTKELQRQQQPHTTPHTLFSGAGFKKNALKRLDRVTPPPAEWRAHPLSLLNICLHHVPTGYSQSSDCERINRANPSYPYLAVGSRLIATL